jgi:hypothetical protein
MKMIVLESPVSRKIAEAPASQTSAGVCLLGWHAGEKVGGAALMVDFVAPSQRVAGKAASQHGLDWPKDDIHRRPHQMVVSRTLKTVAHGLNGSDMLLIPHGSIGGGGFGRRAGEATDGNYTA